MEEIITKGAWVIDDGNYYAGGYDFFNVKVFHGSVFSFLLIRF